MAISGNTLKLSHPVFESTINSVAWNGARPKTELEIVSERGCGARAHNLLDGRQAKESLRSAFSGGDALGFSYFITLTGSKSAPAKSELNPRFFGANRGTELRPLSTPRSDAGI